MDLSKLNPKDAAIIKNNPDLSPYDLLHQKGLSQAAYRKLVDEQNMEKDDARKKQGEQQKQGQGQGSGVGPGQGQGQGMGQGTGQGQGQGQEHGQGQGLNKPEPKEGEQEKEDEEREGNGKRQQDQPSTDKEGKTHAMQPDSVEPIKDKAEPHQPKLSPINERSGDTKKVYNKTTGQTNSMSAKLADDLVRNYPEEFKIVR